MMDHNKYLNKTLKDVSKVLKTTTAAKKNLEKALPNLKKELKDAGLDIKPITEMEKAAKKGNIDELLKAKNKIFKK